MPSALIIWKDTIHFLHYLHLWAFRCKPTLSVCICAHTHSQDWHQSQGCDCQPNDFHLHWWQMAMAWTSTDWKQMKSGPSSPALHLITQHMLEITPKRIWGTLVDLQHEKSSFSSVSFCLIQIAQIIDVVGGRAQWRARLIFSGLADEKLLGGQKGREVWISHPRCGVTAALLVCFSLSAHLEGELRVVFGRLGKRKCKWTATEVGLGMLPPLVLLHRLHHQRIPPIKAAFKAFFSGALSKYRQNLIGHAMPSWGIQTDGPCTSYEAQMRQWEDSKQLRDLDTVWWIIRDAFLWFRTRGEIFNCVAGYKSR